MRVVVKLGQPHPDSNLSEDANSGSPDTMSTDAAETSIERMVARGMTLVPERRELFAEMSVADNLQLGAFQRYRSERDHAQTMDEVFALFPRLR